MERLEFFPLGDAGIVLKLGDVIDEQTRQKVMAISAYLEQQPLPGMSEYVPGYTTVTIYYDPLAWRDPLGQELAYDRFQAALENQLRQLSFSAASEQRVVDIPVCYGGQYGPDLQEVSEYHGLTQEEVIQIHSGQAYIVHMIGFAPAFPYLGGLDKRIATPRRSTPRTAIAPGSVGIGGAQTGVYPLESPGGWQIIGRTPERLFRPEEHPPSLLRAGDRVRFVPISAAEYEQRKQVGR